MKESERLRAAKALIDRPYKWSQGASARDKYGEPVVLSSNEACSYCSVGALSVVSTYNDGSYERSRGYLKAVIPCRQVAAYNDTRSHAEVMQMFDKAIQLAQSEEN